MNKLCRNDFRNSFRRFSSKEQFRDQLTPKGRTPPVGRICLFGGYGTACKLMTTGAVPLNLQTGEFGITGRMVTLWSYGRGLCAMLQ